MHITEQVNPCRTCHIHLKGKSKNRKKCEGCKDRVNYVLSLGWDGVSPAHNVTDFRDINIRTPKSMPTPCVIAKKVSLPTREPTKPKRSVNKGVACQEINPDGKVCGRDAACKGLCWKHYSLMRYYKKSKAVKRGRYKKGRDAE